MAEAKKTLAERLIEVQALLKAPKGQYNSFGKYKYRSCEDILEAVKPLLAERGLLLFIEDQIERIGDTSGTDSLRWYVKATATVTDGTDSVSTTAYAREDESKKGMDGSQVTGASSSYARKYALNALFLIDDTKDADATNTHGAQQASQPTQKAQKPPYKASTPPKPQSAPDGHPEKPQTQDGPVLTPQEMDSLRQSFVNYRDALGLDGHSALAKLLEDTGIEQFGENMTQQEFTKAQVEMGKAIARASGAKVIEG